jgi:hypothetical protein
MKTLPTILLTLFCLSFSPASLALPELPFCPAGGPPGWFNHFVNRHTNNPWHHYQAYPVPQYYQPGHYPIRHQAQPYSAAYARPSRAYSQRPSTGYNRYYQNNR